MKVSRKEKHRAVELYKQGLSVKQVAEQIGVNHKTIRAALEEYGVEVSKSRGAKNEFYASIEWMVNFERQWEAARKKLLGIKTVNK